MLSKSPSKRCPAPISERSSKSTCSQHPLVDVNPPAYVLIYAGNLVSASLDLGFALRIDTLEWDRLCGRRILPLGNLFSELSRLDQLRAQASEAIVGGLDLFAHFVQILKVSPNSRILADGLPLRRLGF